MKKFGNVLWGIVLVLLGLIIGGNRLGITSINIFFDGWWTLLIIIPCFIGLFNETEKTGNIIGLLIGICLLLACLDIVNFDLIWKLLFPAILVVIGLSIIFKDTIGGKVNNEIKKLNEKRSKEDTCCATFSGEKIKYDKEKFTGTDLSAVFGGIECDLRQAVIESDVVINASAIFGGIKIYVPENVKVKTKSTSIFGGVENKSNTNAEENSYTIYVNGTALFGGVEIK